ncbi:MAG: flavodoxin family protein [Desulfobaccales bacterium]|nr:flavodoxin family protein [Desulfobaccales bacterium]
MRVVAFNSSPRDQQTSKTELVLQKFLDGAARAGAVAETIYLRNYRVRNCLGCFACWLKTPGRCIQQDDMTGELFDRLLEADLVVLATPLYYYNMNARLKTFIERTLPMSQPFFEKQGDRTDHPSRFGKVPQVVALSVCGFPEQDNFKALSLNMRMIFGSRLVAEIYRHSSEFLPIEHPQIVPQAAKVLAAVAQAGEEVVTEGKVSSATLEALTQDLAPREVIINLANEHFKQELARLTQE